MLTDKFPPNVVGGAEISLKTTLDHIPEGIASIHVAVLDQPSDSSIKRDPLGARFPVARIAGLGQWPPKYPYPKEGERPLTGLRGRLAWPIAAVRYLFTPNGRGFFARYKRLQAFRALTKRRFIHNMPSFDDDLVPASRTRRQLRSLVREIRPDLIHADNTRSILLAAALGSKAPARVAMVRDNRFLCSRRDQDTHVDGQPCGACQLECLDKEDPEVRRHSIGIMNDVSAYRRACLSKHDGVVTTSAYLEKQVRNIGTVRPIHRVANPALFEPPGNSRRVSSADTPEILVVGMLNDNKGQANVINWIRDVSAQYGFVRFVLAGRGQMAGRLQREAEAAGVSDQLHLAGFLGRDELQTAYQRARLVLIPSIWPEPFGRVPLEAGIAGKPVVAYAVGGLVETIKQGETGFLVPPGDEAALVSRMVWLLQNQAEADAIGLAAQKHIEKTFTPEASASALLESWRSILNEAA
ncbi:MAG: glycosyltransferase family 4 protein [Pseudomonadota bacterium]